MRARWRSIRNRMHMHLQNKGAGPRYSINGMESEYTFDTWSNLPHQHKMPYLLIALAIAALTRRPTVMGPLCTLAALQGS